jgi:hypothetical protein
VRTAQVDLIQLVAYNLAAALRGTVADEFVVEELNPAAVDLFGFRRGAGGGDRSSASHTLLTIEQGAGIRE